jgi:seryl-tRNA synthetase
MLLQGRSYCSKKCQRAAAAIRRKVERHADVVKSLRDELRKAQAETRAAQKARDAAKTRAALSIQRKNEFHAFIVKNLKHELREAQADARSAQKASLKATKELRNYLLTCTCGATVGTIS